MKLRVQSLWSRIEVLASRVLGLGFRNKASGFRVKCLVFELRVEGLGCRVAEDCQAEGRPILAEELREIMWLLLCIPASHVSGLVLRAHRLLYHSTLGSRVIKKKVPRRRERVFY